MYYSLSNGEIQRFRVNVMVDTESGSGNLTSISSPEVLVTDTAGEVQSIAVDWVNDRLYYVQVNETQSQVQDNANNTNTANTLLKYYNS